MPTNCPHSDCNWYKTEGNTDILCTACTRYMGEIIAPFPSDKYRKENTTKEVGMMGFEGMDTNDLLDLSDAYMYDMRKLAANLKHIIKRKDELDKEIIKRLREVDNNART